MYWGLKNILIVFFAVKKPKEGDKDKSFERLSLFPPGTDE